MHNVNPMPMRLENVICLFNKMKCKVLNLWVVVYFQDALLYLVKNLQCLKLISLCLKRLINKLILNSLCYVEIPSVNFFELFQCPEKVIHCQAYYWSCVKDYALHLNRPLANSILDFTMTESSTA